MTSLAPTILNVSSKHERPVGIVWDDDPQYAKQMARLLVRSGFRVITRRDRGKLVEAIKRNGAPVSVAVIDWVDQRNTDYHAGIKTVRWLARHEKSCFVMVTTGHKSELEHRMGPGFASTALKAGADVVKQKGGLRLLRSGEEDFAKEIWYGVARKYAQSIVNSNRDRNLSLRSVFAGVAGTLDPKGQMLNLDRGVAPEDRVAADPQSPIEHQIDQLYDRLRKVASRETPGGQAQYRKLLRELKELQAKEAERMRAYFKANQPLQEERAIEFLKKVETE